jgi:hypothetical protein
MWFHIAITHHKTIAATIIPITATTVITVMTTTNITSNNTIPAYTAIMVSANTAGILCLVVIYTAAIAAYIYVYSVTTAVDITSDEIVNYHKSYRCVENAPIFSDTVLYCCK